jgi:hypothetical protein
LFSEGSHDCENGVTGLAGFGGEARESGEEGGESVDGRLVEITRGEELEWVIEARTGWLEWLGDIWGELEVARSHFGC